ncbi:endolytic transglycosylase MltG [Proteocatella sphenisci]|uniref:endolytic transglycosylase MltG n=1 Tax=Proteocatella sphenisci TaxID=181070 RepID=UPI00048F3B10|nr:endolytic transglycosylase MltG [Proteocatella sphenisci]
MEKLKDFIYEHSDLFFTTVIVIVVGLVVSSSLYGWFNIKDDENKYKEMNEVIHEEQLPNQDTPKENDPGKETDASDQSAPAQQPASPAQPSNGSPATSIKNIEIASGSSSASIASSLEKQGLIKSGDEFLNLLVSSGKETKLKAGTFAITQGSTDSQIIDILTK